VINFVTIGKICNFSLHNQKHHSYNNMHISATAPPRRPSVSPGSSGKFPEDVSHPHLGLYYHSQTLVRLFDLETERSVRPSVEE